MSDQVRENEGSIDRDPDVGSVIYPAQGLLAGEFLCGLWASACDALAIPADQTVRSIRVLRSVLPAWAGERIGPAPAEPSYVADDGFPAELSVNWSGTRPELRLLFDCGLASRDSPWHARSGAVAANRRLGRIHEVFTPQVGRSPAPLWHSVAWRPPSRPVHKTYFGLYAWPLPQRYAAVSEAMRRLRMTAAWNDARRRVEGTAGRREIEFFAVDLADEADARVKIYYRNHGADIGEVNRVASVARHHDAERASAAYRTLTGGRTDAGEAALNCLAFRSGLDGAAECATYLRLAGLASCDREAVDRTAELLRREGVDPGRFRGLATALAPGPLHDSRDLLALVSYRAAGRPGDVTTYFRPPVYDRSVPRPSSPADLAARDRNDDSA
ncbi:hypothetical protein FB471_0111 [Amycolatopsis cihanbeyliensis]|uniref:Tryptophan dimethylallyltransferase n=1 Tax=Amycolatopsis cihanbeyliensis TaxID=1128664 RepID=A0A542DBN9_AMYCI|nr:hypothetical protein FB471_0111 [Amycolatopsis cihanbeyliensis]